MSQKPEILMFRDYPEWDMVDLESRYTIHKLGTIEDKEQYLRDHGANITGVATSGDLGISASMMKLLPNLKIVVCYGVGVDAIDLEYAKNHNIRVTNTPDVLTGDVADIGVGLLISAARHLPEGDALVRSGTWPKAGLPLVTRVFGKRIGIVGMGRIGSCFAQRMSGFECAISYYDLNKRDDLPYAYVGNLVDLAKQSDFLVVTTAGGDGTRGIINKSVLEALGSKGILINISRGSTINEDDLLEALDKGIIKGAGLDVFLNEPNIDSRFFNTKNTVLSPHHASGTIETRKAMGELTRANLNAFYEGRALPTPVV